MGNEQNPYVVLFSAPDVENVTIHSGTKIVYDGAFQNRKNIKNVVLPSGLLSIGQEAFRDCTKLQSITIPDSVATISMYAFLDCPYSLNVYYTGSKEQRDKMAIVAYNERLENATWHYDSCPVGALHSYDNECDISCNACGKERIIYHIYTSACDEECDICGNKRSGLAEHTFVGEDPCSLCGAPPYVIGDLDGVEGVTDADAVYLLYHTFLPDLYPLH